MARWLAGLICVALLAAVPRVVLAQSEAAKAASDDRANCATLSNETEDPSVDFDTAMAACDALIARNDKDAAAHVNRALGHIANEDYQRGLADAERAVKLDFTSAAALAVRGNARWAMDLSGAFDDLTRAIDLEPAVAKRWSDRADYLVSAKRYLEAIEDRSRAIELEPGNAALYVARGYVLGLAERPDEALADYDKAIQLATDKESFYQSKAHFLSGLDRKREATQALSDGLAALPKSINLLRERSRLAVQDNRHDDALADYAAIIALDAESGLLLRAAFYDGQNKLDLALADYDELVKRAPRNVTQRAARARLLHRMKRHDLALADLDKGLELEPTYYWLLQERIRFNTERSPADMEAALADLGKLIEIAPEEGWRYTLRARHLRDMNRPELALVDDDMAVSLNPKDVQAYVSRVESNWQLSRLDAVIDDSDKAVTLAPDSSSMNYYKAWYVTSIGAHQTEDLLYALVPAKDLAATARMRGDLRAAANMASAELLYEAAFVLLKGSDQVAAVGFRAVRNELAGKLRVALEDCDTLVAQEPNDARLYAMRARVREKVGDAVGGLDDLDKAIKLQPKGTWLYLQRARLLEKSPLHMDEPKSTFDKLVEMHPENGWILNQRAEYLHRSKRYADALQDYSRSLALNETREAFEARASLLMETGDFDAAAQDFTELIALDPEAFALYGGRGYARFRGGRLLEAAQDYGIFLFRLIQFAYLP